MAEAVADDTCRAWLEEWWSEASAHLSLPADDVAAYREALLERFANPRMRHRLDQIAADGSQKLPIRILPVAAARARGGPRSRRRDARARRLGVPPARRAARRSTTRAPTRSSRSRPDRSPTPSPGSWASSIPALAADDDLATAVRAHAEELERQGRP